MIPLARNWRSVAIYALAVVGADVGESPTTATEVSHPTASDLEPHRLSLSAAVVTLPAGLDRPAQLLGNAGKFLLAVAAPALENLQLTLGPRLIVMICSVAALVVSLKPLVQIATACGGTCSAFGHHSHIPSGCLRIAASPYASKMIVITVVNSTTNNINNRSLTAGLPRVS